jgi:hypothetical protein
VVEELNGAGIACFASEKHSLEIHVGTIAMEAIWRVLLVTRKYK